MIKVIGLPENTGSANGYKVGIEAASSVDADFIWLLDDDNKPLPGSLDNLLLTNELLGLNERCALLSLRRDRKELVSAAYCGSPVCLVKNSFMGFHVRDVFLKVIDSVFRKKVVSDVVRFPLVAVEYAPYGGFFFHKRWLVDIGVPKTDFYLYADDHEYTSRITLQGGNIYLCANSEVIDLETSWHLKEERIPAIFSTSVHSNRIYYGIRNRVYFEKQRLVSNRLVYGCNILFFFSIMVLKSLLFGASIRHVLKRLSLVIAAYNHGKSGILGRIKNCKLA